MKFRKAIIGAAIFLVQVACSTMQTTSSWSNQQPHQVKMVAVLGVMDHNPVCQSYENEIVTRLQREGINAIAAYRIVHRVRTQTTVDRMVGKLYAEGVDAVMVVSVSDINRSRNYVPGFSYVRPATYYHRFGNYYVRSYQRVHTSGYVRRSTILYLETNLCHLQSQQLLWASESKSINPGSLENASRSHAKSIVKALHKQAIV